MNPDLERLIEIYAATQFCRAQEYADLWDAWKTARDEEAAKRKIESDRLEALVEKLFLQRSEKAARRKGQK